MCSLQEIAGSLQNGFSTGLPNLIAFSEARFFLPSTVNSTSSITGWRPFEFLEKNTALEQRAKHSSGVWWTSSCFALPVLLCLCSCIFRNIHPPPSQQNSCADLNNSNDYTPVPMLLTYTSPNVYLLPAHSLQPVLLHFLHKSWLKLGE